eukprot:GDKJ01008995.1.p2 GENE.GDKJ01008995.1~~GDKJ01008995.1.p2  ORF type:complete len:476 (+),score=147.46 GDKJ01008995.1:18-1445(+)
MKLAKSKRIASKLRNNVEKRVKDHKKKVRKMAKDNPEAVRKAHRKDPGIPNSFPYKEEAIKEIMARKEYEAEELRKKNQLDRERRQMMKMGHSVEEIAALVEKRHAAFHAKEEANATAAAEVSDFADADRHVFWKELNKVVEMSDVIVQVLDARDPEGCRSKELEDQVILAGKKLVLILNKIDLVPREAVKAWITRLSREHPVKAFKSARNVQHKATHAHVAAEEANDGLLQSSATVVGAEEVIELLKNYSRCGDRKLALTVGIVGYPNVGKSSVINSLLRRNQCVKVGGEAGVTRELQSVQLDSKVRLVDSPGVVFNKKNDAASVLRNAVKLQNIRDPESIIKDLIQKVPVDLLCRHYNIPLFDSSESFIYHVAAKLGKLKKGGVPDVIATCVAVLKEWTSGAIKYHSMPAADNDPNASIRIVFTQTSSEKEKKAILGVADEDDDGAVTVATAYEGLKKAAKKANGEEDSDVEM